MSKHELVINVGQCYKCGLAIAECDCGWVVQTEKPAFDKTDVLIPPTLDGDGCCSEDETKPDYSGQATVGERVPKDTDTPLELPTIDWSRP